MPYTNLKIALVHDYLREFGGAERVLRTLSDIYPDAPIYVSFSVKNSTGAKEFSDRKVNESFLAPILKIWKLYSPLRILTPVIWRSMDLSKYDIVITSAGWYITRGFKVGKNTKVICYCHTPPRWLYGFETAGRYQKYWPVKIYAAINRWILKKYDKWSVKTVDVWIANSKNVEERIMKFYNRDPLVIYPPIEYEKIKEATKNTKKEDYIFIASRITGAKGLEDAVKAANKYKFKLKIAGEAADVSGILTHLKKIGGEYVEFLGRVSDDELYGLYGKAKGFIVLAKDEDFGMTPVEAMSAGTPVIAYNGGGFKESVIDGKTGILVNSVDTKTIGLAVKKLNKKKWNKSEIQKHAQKFSRERFVQQMYLIMEKVR